MPLLTCFIFKEKKPPQNFGGKSWPFSRASIWKRCQNAYELRRRQLGTQIVHLVLFRNLVKLQRMAQVPVVVLDRGNNTTCTINLHGSTIVSWRVNNQVRQFLKKFLVLLKKMAKITIVNITYAICWALSMCSISYC